MAWQGELNSTKIDINNWEDLKLNFETSTSGINTTFTSSFSPEFVKSRSRGGVNPLKHVLDTIKNTPFPSKIPFKLVSSNEEEKIEGSLIPYASGNEFGEENPKIIKVLWEYNKTNFFEQAQALSLTSFLDRSDFERVRYIREGVPDYIDGLFITLAGTIIGIQVAEQFYKLQQLIKDFIVALTPDGIPPIPMTLKAAVIAVLEIIIQAAYLVLLLIVLNDLLKALSEAIFQKPRAYYCLNVLNVLKKGCNELGLSFESSFFNGINKDLMLLIATTKQGTLKSAPSNNPIPQKNFAQFMTEWAAPFNGKGRITNDGKFQLESQKFFDDKPEIEGLQLQKNYATSVFDLNTEELISRFTLKYATATTDNHYDREAVEITYKHKYINFKDLGINGNLDVSLPYTIAKRKGRTAGIDKFFNKIFDLFASLSGRYKIRGGNRQGYILLQYDQVPVDMIFYRAGSEKIKDKAEQTLGAVYLYENYYKETIAPYNNQYYRYKRITQQPQFVTEDLLKMVDNPNIKDDNGNKITITRSSYDENEGVSGYEYKRKIQPGELGYMKESDFIEIQNVK